ncbi:MAG: hypothetical protein NT011_02575 [Kiritimatiellaeota bacterium]|nr:hypothetical protein [Kiritimatiellota bacterium]
MIKTVYLCCASHVDIGYTHLPDEVRDLQFQATGDVLQACVATQDRPEWERFRWTFESGWVVRDFLARCTPDERLVFADLLRKKQIEITAFFTQFLPQLPGLEELIEALRYTTELGREIGVPVVTANLNDIGGNSLAFPQVLARAGVCYYLFGSGGWRVHCLQCSLPHLFWHEGPDGSRLLFYRLGYDKTLQPSACTGLNAPYGFGGTYFTRPYQDYLSGLRHNNLAFSELGMAKDTGPAALKNLLQRFQSEGYPAEQILLQLGGDNGRPDKSVCDLVAEWNRRERFPEIRLATPAQFFADLSRECKEALPVLRGEISCPWSNHALTTARETGIYRQAGRRIVSAICLSGVNRTAPPFNVDAAFEELTHFSDHTFGISMWGYQDSLRQGRSMHDTLFALPRESWQNKTDYALAADRYGRSGLFRAARGLADRVKSDQEGQFVVINSCSFPRRGLVDYNQRDFPEKIALRDCETDAILPCDCEPSGGPRGRLRFFSPEVPAFGYRVFAIVPDAQLPPSPLLHVTPALLENEVWRITFDPKTGRIVSLLEKATRREWLDTQQDRSLGEFIYCRVEGLREDASGMGISDAINWNWATEVECEPAMIYHGSAYGKVVYRRHLTGGPVPVTVEQEIVLAAGSGQIELVTTIIKHPTVAKEAGFIVFPFAIPKPAVVMEQAGCLVRIPQDQLPGSAQYNIGIQDWVGLWDHTRKGLLIGTDQAGLFSMAPLQHYGNFDLPVAPETGCLYLHLFHNTFNTNCPIYQGGVLPFRVTIMPLPDDDPTRAWRNGMASNRPLLALPLAAGRGEWSERSKSLLSISPDNVLVSIARQTDPVLLLRLVEMAGKHTEVVLNLADTGFVRWSACDFYGHPVDEQGTNAQGAVTTVLEPFMIKTLRIETALDTAQD